LPYLFPPRNHQPINRKRIDTLFRTYTTQAGLLPDKRHAHCLRHSIVTHLLDAGQSLEYVQDHLGHRSIQSTGVYAKISDAKRERVSAQIELAREVAKIKRSGHGEATEAHPRTQVTSEVCMERYLFYDPDRIPPGLHVIGVPTSDGLVWMEISPAEYDAAIAYPKAARQLVAYVREVLANRLPRPEVHDEETRREGKT